jgi:signal transduction histidine kinase
MSAEQISNLFQNFTKIKSHRDLNKEGVGLGLTISKNLAKALGGDIYVDSEIGKGSRFVLKIPVTYPSQQNLEEKKYDFNRH